MFTSRPPVDIRDVALLLGRMTSPVFDAGGDLNADGKVDVRDLALVLRHMGHHA